MLTTRTTYYKCYKIIYNKDNKLYYEYYIMILSNQINLISSISIYTV